MWYIYICTYIYILNVHICSSIQHAYQYCVIGSDRRIYTYTFCLSSIIKNSSDKKHPISISGHFCFRSLSTYESNSPDWCPLSREVPWRRKVAIFLYLTFRFIAAVYWRALFQSQITTTSHLSQMTRNSSRLTNLSSPATASILEIFCRLSTTSNNHSLF